MFTFAQDDGCQRGNAFAHGIDVEEHAGVDARSKQVGPNFDQKAQQPQGKFDPNNRFLQGLCQGVYSLRRETKT